MRKITLLGALALTVVSFSASAQDVAGVVALNKDTVAFLQDLLHPYTPTATVKAVAHKHHRKAKQT